MNRYAMLTGLGMALLALPVVGLTGHHRLLQHLMPRAQLVQAMPPGAAAAAPSTAPDEESVRLCVTDRGICPTGPLPAGSPCTCTHTLQGLVAGHVFVPGQSFAAPQTPWVDGEREEDEGYYP